MAPDPSAPAERLTAWVAEHLPREWFTALDVRADKDEVLVVCTLPPESEDHRGDGREAAITRFRERTREQRMALAKRMQPALDRTVSWGARDGDVEVLFTTVSAPAMTRLRLAERQVLDTLIDAGVARSRSDALAWCVRLVGANEDAWLAELRAAFEAVEAVRRKGPASTAPAE